MATWARSPGDGVDAGMPGGGSVMRWITVSPRKPSVRGTATITRVGARRASTRSTLRTGPLTQVGAVIMAPRSGWIGLAVFAWEPPDPSGHRR